MQEEEKRMVNLMTLNELKNRLEAEKHITGSIQIECGKKSEFPGILGIYEENGRWYIYHTKDRGGIVVLDHGSEEDMTEALYRRILKIEKRLLKELQKKC